MKMTEAHLVALAEAIKPFDTGNRRSAYLMGDFPRADLVKDLDRRYRWDLFYAARGWLSLGDGDYYDSHIDTALRRIVRPLGEEN